MANRTVTNANEVSMLRVPMNIFEKLQRCRVELQNSKLKKSGKNKFANYDYFELSDFRPRINELLLENKLTSIFHFTSEIATLEIIDMENVAEVITFATPVAMAELKGTHAIQNIGATQTYTRRYLYVMAFEISENDMLDAMPLDNKPKPKQQPQTEAEFDEQPPISKNQIAAMEAALLKTKTDKEKFLNYWEVDSIEGMTQDCYIKAMKALETKASKMPKEEPKQDEELPNV